MVIGAPLQRYLVVSRINFYQHGSGLHVLNWRSTPSISLLANSQVPGSEGLFSPRWSPDGHYLAAMTQDSAKIMLFDFGTRKWTVWVDEPGSIGFPNWSADGKYLYYDTSFSQHSTFRRIKVGQTASDLVADLADFHKYTAFPVFGWSSIAPDGSMLFVRDLSTDEIYALDLELP